MIGTFVANTFPFLRSTQVCRRKGASTRIHVSKIERSGRLASASYATVEFTEVLYGPLTTDHQLWTIATITLTLEEYPIRTPLPRLLSADDAGLKLRQIRL